MSESAAKTYRVNRYEMIVRHWGENTVTKNTAATVAHLYGRK